MDSACSTGSLPFNSPKSAVAVRRIALPGFLSMELKPGMSALVTGGGSGIGRAVALALAQKGLFVTVVDYSEKHGQEAAFLIEKENRKFHQDLSFPSTLFVKCDVTNSGDVTSAFKKHVETYGGLDICVNSAGITISDVFHEDGTDGYKTWRRVVDVNLLALMDCTSRAIQIMRSKNRPGVILNLGSAAGLYPMPMDPIYSASKGGVVLFTRSLAYLKRYGIRVNVLCPEFVKTDMGQKVNPKYVNASGGFVQMDNVIQGAFELITDESKSGACLWITNRRGSEYWPKEEEKKKYLLKKSRNFTQKMITNINIPHSYEKIIVHTLGNDFRNVTKIIPVQLSLPIKPDHVLVKIVYAGINASDVNFSSGRYFSTKAELAKARLPFDAGFEAVGIVASVGEMVPHFKVGTPVALMTFGSYAEFVVVPAKHLILVPRPDPEVVAMLTSGLTASIALDKVGQMASQKTVLVTAAAGGTGQFAVQIAKLAGHKVIATCGGERKAVLLKSLGVDRVINYRTESIKEVLKKEFREGVDVIYESVGGEMFNLCLDALAVHGHLIVIGMISQYQGGWKLSNYTGICEKLLQKSQTLIGFFLVQYAHLWQEHLDKLLDLYFSGKLKVAVDPKKFVGLGSVADAVEHLYSGESLGKIVVCIDPTYSVHAAKL